MPSPLHDRSHALRGNAALDAPASTTGSCVLRCDAERHGLAPTPERGSHRIPFTELSSHEPRASKATTATPQSGPFIKPLIGSIP